MHLSALPTEIFEQILDCLPRHSKQQCLVVNKAWYTIVLPKLNTFIQLHDTQDVLLLYEKLLNGTGSIEGSDIQCLALSAERTSDRYMIRRDALVYILNSCKNLKTLYLMYDSNQFLEYMYQNRQRLNIASLKTIYIPFNILNRVGRSSELTAAYYYSHKIAQLSLNISRDVFQDTIDELTLGIYLLQFTVLTDLSIEFDNEVFLHDILVACPQLRTLRLSSNSFISFNAKLHVYRRNDSIKKPKQPCFKPQLSTIFIDIILVNKDLLEYLTSSTTQLYQLTLRGSLSYSTQRFINALSDYSSNKNTPALHQLPVKHLQLENSIALTKDLLHHMSSCFPNLKRLDLIECVYTQIVHSPNNIALNFADLDLEYLSIDIHNLYSILEITKTDLEIVMSNGNSTNNTRDCSSLASLSPTTPVLPSHALYFQRQSKWKRESLFIVKDSKHFIGAQARNRRFHSPHTCVLSIKAKSIHYIRLHCGDANRQRTFNQIIDLYA